MRRTMPPRGKENRVARLNLFHNRWLAAFAAPRADVRTHAAPPAPAVSPEDAAAMSTLGREANALPAAFARARSPLGAGAGSNAPAAAAIESERCARAALLEPVAEGLRACRRALEGCGPRLPASHRIVAWDALHTLETEYVRLRDAEKFSFERRLRRIETEEADDDPDFTIVLDRVVYAVNEGDEVEASVALAVQTIAGVLPPRFEHPGRLQPRR